MEIVVLGTMFFVVMLFSAWYGKVSIVKIIKEKLEKSEKEIEHYQKKLVDMKMLSEDNPMIPKIIEKIEEQIREQVKVSNTYRDLL